MDDNQTLSSTHAVRTKTSTRTSSAKRQTRRKSQTQRDSNGLFSKFFQPKSSNNLPKDSTNGTRYTTEFKVGFETTAPINSLRIPPPRKSSRGGRKHQLSPETKRRLRLLNDDDASVTSAPADLNIPSVKQSIKSCPTITEVVVPNPSSHNQYDSSQKRYTDTRRCKSMEHKHGFPTVIKSRTAESNVSSMNSTEVESILKNNGQSYKNNDTYDDRRRNLLRKSASERLPPADKSLNSQQLLRMRKSESVKDLMKVPDGEITIVVTDIQGSTSLWEFNALIMKKASDLHDSILRKCYSKHGGYEITTEGDSFQLAFHHPLDAFSFCLEAQVTLYDADWPEEIYSRDMASVDESKCFRGLRVRMGLHHGLALSYVHDVTLRTYFKGDALIFAKNIEKICHGGQIVTTMETWKSISGMAERYLGSPQVLDLGEYTITDDELYCNFKDPIDNVKRLVQLVPKRFAFDFFSWKQGYDPPNEESAGRRFPRLKSKEYRNDSFFDAPRARNYVTIVFVHTVFSISNLTDNAKTKNTSKLSKIIRLHLAESQPPGYECQEDNGNWMLAFHSLVSAAIFSVKLIDCLLGAPVTVKIGIHAGRFTSMGPHTVTGRADYFGPVVNRCSRVANSANGGEARLGLALEDASQEIIPPDFGNGIDVRFVDRCKFKGVNVDMAVFSCHSIDQEGHLNGSSNVVK